MNRRPNFRHLGVVVAVVLPLTAVLASSTLQAQTGFPKKQPFPTPPKIEFPKTPTGPIGPKTQPPKLEQVWNCGKCGKVAGTGTFAPSGCPHCNVKFING